MRSSKSRSRGKSNRNRNSGNNLNRVFDSSGPEGKVRGTPQQIIDKYAQLARDAALANDRVAAENFQQHGEHYTRLLNEATRDAEVRRQQAEQANRERQQRERSERETRADKGKEAQGSGEQPDVVESNLAGDSGLVETPESAPKKRPSRARRAAKPENKPDTDDPAPTAAVE